MAGTSTVSNTTKKRVSANDFDKGRKKAEERSSSTYVSPIKKIKLAIQAREATNIDKPIISTVEGSQEFVRNNGVKWNNLLLVKNDLVRNTIYVQDRVIWTSFHIGETGPVARMHLIDPSTPDSLPEMYAATRDKYATEKMAVDDQLIATSMYGMDEQAVGRPADGQIVTVVRTTKLGLFMDTVCQLTAKLHDISVSDD